METAGEAAGETETAGARERRTRPRYPVDLAVQVRAQAASFSGRVRDISCLGLLVSSEQVLDVGTVANLLLELPGAGAIEAYGQVIRIEPCDAGLAMAILFSPMPRATLSRIDSFLQQARAAAAV
jgi:hypothetical protein